MSRTNYPLETMTTLSIPTNAFYQIDITEAAAQIGAIAPQWQQHEQSLTFDINFEQEEGDPRELSEIPEVRLWFVRLDARYPWLPLLLDWKGGELARYFAMLVPHQFHPKDGIIYNPEALELLVMHKAFVVTDWLQSQGLEGRSRVKAMTQLMGYELEDGFFDVIGA
jgi:hypothetical protein